VAVGVREIALGVGFGIAGGSGGQVAAGHRRLAARDQCFNVLRSYAIQSGYTTRKLTVNPSATTIQWA
jgi:hypothetical protein